MHNGRRGLCSSQKRGKAFSCVRHTFRSGDHHWTLVMEPAGFKSQYSAYAQPFGQADWEMGAGGSRYWWPRELHEEMLELGEAG